MNYRLAICQRGVDAPFKLSTDMVHAEQEDKGEVMRDR